MGLLRLLFALSVLMFHAGQLYGYSIVPQHIAVLSFFVISGFYMALILDKKYKGRHATWLFISNRFLRIFPLYWVTLGLMICFTAIKFFFHLGTSDNAITHYITYTAHTSYAMRIFTLINYLLRNITLIFTADYFFVNDNTPGYLLVQQAWTLQIEVLFYLIVPFIINVSKRVFFLFIFGYITVFFCIVVPFHVLPQGTLFYLFLNNLLFFLLGILSYQYLYKILVNFMVPSYISVSLFSLFVVYVLIYSFFAVPDVLYFIVFLISLPFIFLITKDSVFDIFIGKLSYPVYITHFLVIKLLSNLPVLRSDANIKTCFIILITIVISLLAVKYIENPINTFRQKKVKNNEA